MMNNMKKCNFVIAGITACLGIAIMVSSEKLSLKFTNSGPGSGFWPMILGGVFVLTSICLLVLTLVRKQQLSQIPVVLGSGANKRVYVVMGIIIVYCILLKLIGFYVATLLFIPAVMFIMEERSVKKMFLTSVIAVATIYIIFAVLLKTRMPVSVLF